MKIRQEMTRKYTHAITVSTKEKFVRKPKTFVFETIKIQWTINQPTLAAVLRKVF